MFKFLIGFLASVSSVFTNGANKSNTAPPLNTAIIAYRETYYVPVVAGLENFPWAKKNSETKTSTTKSIVVIKPTIMPPPQQTTPPPPPTEPEDPYLSKQEPAINWLLMQFTPNGYMMPIKGSSDQTFSNFSTDREYWKIQVDANWISPNPNSKLPVEKDYFKLEVYEEGTNKLIYTMTSGTEEWYYKSQTFRKPGKYYFKIYSHIYGKYEINIFVSPKIAQ
ncbi:MAG: hypothetical protein AAB456_02295 [Patescibacteria group bacterium]